jgi:hypothetical protein
LANKKISELDALTTGAVTDIIPIVDLSGAGVTSKITKADFLKEYLPATRGTFDNGDLASGILTITHNLDLDAPYTMILILVKNTGVKFSPDYVCAANTITVDLSLWGVISGTWGYILIG